MSDGMILVLVLSVAIVAQVWGFVWGYKSGKAANR